MDKIVRFNILGWVTTSWTYGTRTANVSEMRLNMLRGSQRMKNVVPTSTNICTPGVVSAVYVKLSPNQRSFMQF